MIERIAVVFFMFWFFSFGFGWGLMRFYSERNSYQKKTEYLLLVWFLAALLLLTRGFILQKVHPEVLNSRLLFGGGIMFLLTLHVISPPRMPKWIWRLALGVYLLLYVLYKICVPEPHIFYHFSDLLCHKHSLQVMLLLTIMVVMIFLTVFSVFLVFKQLKIYQSHIENSYSNPAYDMSWLNKVGVFYFVCVLFYLLRLVWLDPISQILYSGGFAAMFWMVIDHVFRQKGLPDKDEFRAWTSLQYLRKNSRLEELPPASAQITYPELKTWLEDEKPYRCSEFCAEDVFEKFPDIPRRDLAQILQQIYGLNFMNTVQKLRIDEAAAYLRENHKLSLKELSYRLGFANQSAFTRSFKQVMGVSPSEYKKSKKINTED